MSSNNEKYFLNQSGLEKYDELIKKYIIDKRGTPLWVGTQAEYELHKDEIEDGTFVIITDGEEPVTSIIGLDKIRYLFTREGSK